MRILCTLITLSCLLTQGYSQIQIINEIHYDNSGSDVDEFIEVFIENPQPTDVSDWEVVLYNGNGGSTYGTHALSTFTAALAPAGHVQGFFYTKFIAGIQNGAPDGVALADDIGNVIEFISYEGEMTATDGPASGLTSIDIGVSETGSAAVGTSMQNDGAGNWVTGELDTPGAPNVNTILPVEFTAFDATLRNGKVQLEWATATEKNNAGFEVERSADGKSFESIGFERGEGNSYENVDYTYTDYSPLAGLSYYRLKQVDFDGAYDYSKMVAVRNLNGRMTISPSSTSTYVTVSTNSDAAGTVYMYNSIGMLTQTATTDNGTAMLDLADLQSGIYFVQIEIDGQVYTEKVIRD